MSELANTHNLHVQRGLEDMQRRIAKHRAEMELIHSAATQESEALLGEPLEGEVLEPAGAEFHSIETGPDTSAPALGSDEVAPFDNGSAVCLPGLELAQFERTVISVLDGYVDDLHYDNGHAKSEQYQHVMVRRLQRAVELLDGVAE